MSERRASAGRASVCQRVIYQHNSRAPGRRLFKPPVTARTSARSNRSGTVKAPHFASGTRMCGLAGVPGQYSNVPSSCGAALVTTNEMGSRIAAQLYRQGDQSAAVITGIAARAFLDRDRKMSSDKYVRRLRPRNAPPPGWSDHRRLVLVSAKNWRPLPARLSSAPQRHP